MAEARQVLVTEAEAALIAGAGPRGGEPQWLADLRASALRAFGAEGLPDRKIEAFHYTDLKALLRAPYPPARAQRASNTLTFEIGALAHRLAAYAIPLVNGAAMLRDAHGPGPGDGVEILPLGAAIAVAPEVARFAFDGDVEGRAKAVHALNTGLARDGLVIRVRSGAKAAPIVLHHRADLKERGALHLRNLVVLEADAEASLTEIFEDTGEDYLLTAETLVHLAAGARLTHAKLVGAGERAVYLGRTQAHLAAKSEYKAFILGTGAQLAREESALCFEGEEAQGSLAGTLMLAGEQHFDLASRIDHTAAHGSSLMAVRAALAGRAKGIVEGAVRVAPGAQATDANQQLRGLLLSPRAEFDAKPELEILADDVKCSHGAASGDLDEEAVFYLRARGIPEAEARALLVRAFLEESFSKIESAALRELVREKAARWLERVAKEGSDG